MKKGSAILLAMILLFAVPLFAGANEEGRKGKGKGEMMAGLKLTDAQKEQFKAVKEERKAAQKEFQEKMKGIREKLKKEVDEATPNDVTLKSLLGELDAAMTARDQKMQAIKTKMTQFLTPLQQARMALKFGNRDRGEGRKGGRDGEYGDHQGKKKGKHGKKEKDEENDD